MNISWIHYAGWKKPHSEDYKFGMTFLHSVKYRSNFICWGFFFFPSSCPSQFIEKSVNTTYVINQVSILLESIMETLFSSVQWLSHVWLFATPWTAARQASLSITNFRSSLKLMSIESVMPPNHLLLCRSLLLPAFNLSQHQGLFKGVSSSHQVAKVLEFQLQHQSFQWTSRTDLL